MITVPMTLVAPRSSLWRHHRVSVERSLSTALPGQYAYAGFMPNKPSYVAKAIPASGSDEEKVSSTLPHQCELEMQSMPAHALDFARVQRWAHAALQATIFRHLPCHDIVIQRTCTCKGAISPPLL